MKKFLLFCLSVLFFMKSGFAQMGIGTSAPDSSAMLDVFSNNKGFLPPRIALVAINLAAPVNKPATGLLVYNTATAGEGTMQVLPGYYYWNGNEWQPFINKGNAPGDMLYWNGSQWTIIPVGVNGSVLTLCNGVPRWGACPDTILTLSPSNSPTETFVYSYYPNTPGIGTTNLLAAAWTHNGTPSTARSLLKFDFLIPAGATVRSAKLSLYAASPHPNSGNLIDAHYGTSNAMAVQRVTSVWNATNVTWNSQPSTTTVNQVVLPNSTSASQNDTDIDVTQLVKDMQQYGNNGFSLKLINEIHYNSRQYFSSYHSDPAKHPKLVITLKY